MNWYDLVAPVYDRAIRSLSLPSRERAVSALRLEQGHTVLDLGCGAGLNFELKREAIGPEGGADPRSRGTSPFTPSGTE